MRNRFTKLVATATAFAAVAAVVGITGTAQAALPASAAPTAGQTISVTSGVQSTPFSFSYTGDNACAGDSATNGYRVQSFMVPDSVDVSQLLYNAGGPIAPAGVTFTRPLFAQVGNAAQVARNTAPTTGIITAGNLVQPLSFAALVAGSIAVPDGAYKIGLACTLGGITEEYWQTRITVSGSTTGPVAFNWAVGAAPAAPVLGALTAGNGTLTGTFTAAAADPVATYTITTVPATVSTVGTPGTPFTLSGLTNGTSYAVTVTASNGVGGPVVSNTVNGTPTPGAVPAPSPFTATSSVGQIVLNWTPAAVPAGATLVNHLITSTPALAGSPFTVAAGTNTLTVTAAPGSYSFTIQATYTPGLYVGATATAVASSNNAQSLIQDITVVRPVGALVLTQRCGVYGSAAAYSDNVFGSLPALPASPAGADPIAGDYTAPAGSAPTLTVGGAADPLFSQYPYPVTANGDATATYPTHCGIDLGTGRLITSGPRAGQYFTANGRMAQITVVNTQDVDNGWTLNGRMSAFTRTGGGDSFSGNLLGWDPEVTFDSAPNLDGYDMVVVAGGVRQPASTASTTGLGDVSNESNTSLSQALAKVNGFNAGTNTGSLGMAVLDARLRLLIPVSANAGTYTGTLTFTTV